MSHNAKVKIYDDARLVMITVLSAPLYGRTQSKEDVLFRTSRHSSHSMSDDGCTIRRDSLKRSKDRVRELCLLNDFDMFVTLTIDPSKLDSSDSKAVKKAFDNWKRNMASRYDMKAVFVPEYHKDGKKIHFHGLVSGRFRLIKSGHKDSSGRDIYNLDNWKYGFTTAVMLDGDYRKVCSYITKYITKDNDRVFSQSYFTCGELVQQPNTIYTDIDFATFQGKEYKVGDTCLSVKYRSDDIDDSSLEE